MEYYMEQVIWKNDSCMCALDKLLAVSNKLVMWHVLYITVHVCKNLALSTFFETAVIWSGHSAQSRLFSKIQFISNHQQDNGRIQNSCGLAVVIPTHLLWLFIPWAADSDSLQWLHLFSREGSYAIPFSVFVVVCNVLPWSSFGITLLSYSYEFSKAPPKISFDFTTT